MNERGHRRMTVLVAVACALSIAAWACTLKWALSWPAVLGALVCAHGWAVVFGGNHIDRHVFALLVWGPTAAWVLMSRSPSWVFAGLLSVPVGIQCAMLLLHVAFEVPHRIRRQRNAATGADRDPLA